MKKILIALITLLTVVSCSKTNDDIKPEDKGTYQVYTNMADAKFDQIEVKLDGKAVGTLTKPFLTTTQQPTPSCGSDIPGVVIRLERPGGSYSLDAIATLNGKQVAKWSGAIRIDAGTCGKTKLNDN